MLVVGPEESSFVGDADAVGQTIVASARSAIFDPRAGCFDHAIDASDALEQGALGQRRRLGHMTIYLRGVKNPARPSERDGPAAFGVFA